MILDGLPETYDFQSGGDPYSLRGLEDGTYYIIAVIDYNGSGGNPDLKDVESFYDSNHDGTPDPVIISSANRVTGIDFEFQGSQRYLSIISR